MAINAALRSGGTAARADESYINGTEAETGQRGETRSGQGLPNASENDTVDALSKRINRAPEMREAGNTGSAIFAETGLVSMNGLLADGFDGPIVWSAENVKETGRGGNTEIPSADETRMAGREDTGTGEPVSHERVGYDGLSRDQQAKAAGIIGKATGHILMSFMDDGASYDDAVKMTFRKRSTAAGRGNTSDSSNTSTMSPTDDTSKNSIPQTSPESKGKARKTAATPWSRRTRTYIVSAYMSKSGVKNAGDTRLTDANSPVFTANTDNVPPAADGSIPQAAPESKSEIKRYGPEMIEKFVYECYNLNKREFVGGRLCAFYLKWINKIMKIVHILLYAILPEALLFQTRR